MLVFGRESAGRGVGGGFRKIADKVGPIRVEAAAETDGIVCVRHGSPSIKMWEEKGGVGPGDNGASARGWLAGTDAMRARGEVF